MAEAVTYAAASALIELISHVPKEIGLVCGVKREVQKLGRLLTRIQAVLQDAETKQIRGEVIKLWVKKLKDMAIDAEDILDEVAYNDLRRVIETRNGRYKVRGLFSLSIPLELRFRIGHRIKDLNLKFEEIAEDKFRFQFLMLGDPTTNVVNSERVNLSRGSIPFVDESEIVGRESDKSNVSRMLIGSKNHALSVISIVGPVGVGKTTLAQLVYNDEAVRDYFELRMWISVGDDFVVKRLFTQILKQILHKNCELTSMNEMGNWLQRELSEKRFLLVLDDVSDDNGDVDDKWDNFTLPLRCCGSVGSKIIVTTRSQTVASNVQSTYTYFLNVLSEDDCQTIFERIAFRSGGPERTYVLEDIGRKIVKKCEGVPLLAKRLGGLMRFKRVEQDWLHVLNSEIRNILNEQYDGIDVFNISFSNLPSQLNQCFLYCSIFPKDYEVKKETLIQLWMAQGFLKASNENELMEDIGNEYFNLLYSMSFQDVKRNEFGDIIACKMNSSVHDRARSIAKSECQVVEVSDQMLERDLSDCRHLSLISDRARLTIPVSAVKLKKLRTFCLLKTDGSSDRPVVTPRTNFSSKSLRVLDLSGTSIGGFRFSIDNLKHLRYLDLSETDIEVLPKCITQLYNLQTLKLEKCECLKKLPRHLANLIKLRHFHIDSSGKWEEMPRKMGRLHFLQTLPIFKLSKEDPEGSIRDLKCLKSLRGRLDIFHLENARGNMFTDIACLKGIENIDTLSLQWNDEMRDRNIEICEEEEHDNVVALLEMLQPHTNLKILQIRDFPGVEFPRWVTSGSELSTLVEMNLQGCYKLEHIQSFGELPNLKVLHMCEMSNVKCIGGSKSDCKTSITDITDEQEATMTRAGAATFYPHLKRLILVEMPNLEEWLEDAGLNFYCLEQLTVRKCPKLRKMPHLFPSLKELDIEEVGGMGLISITDWPKLQGFLSENDNSLLEFR